MKPAPSIPLIDAQQERYDMYRRNRYGLPFMYGDVLRQGLA
ncbi:MAG: hypothetical protein ACXWZS_10865 [Gemmatirosa sp.]